MNSFPQLIRVANRLQAAMKCHRQPQGSTSIGRLPELQDRASRIQRQLSLTLAKGWFFAFARLKQELQEILLTLQRELAEIQDQETRPSSTSPSLAEWLSELQNIGDEFEEWEIHWKDHYLAVSVGPITFEDVDLGTFSIRLFWDRLGRDPGIASFDVVALEPNPPSSNEDVTHPHVRNDELCAGDATAPIKTALLQGRIVDAFLLIQNVLIHYNPNSVHVSLESWEGISCDDCGRTTSPDDICTCNACRDEFCDDCLAFCQICEEPRCSSCQTQCEVCQESCCPSCLKRSACSAYQCCPACLVVCKGCGRRVGRDECDEGGRCILCQPQDFEDDQSETIPDSSTEASHDCLSTC